MDVRGDGEVVQREGDTEEEEEGGEDGGEGLVHKEGEGVVLRVVAGWVVEYCWGLDGGHGGGRGGGRGGRGITYGRFCLQSPRISSWMRGGERDRDAWLCVVGVWVCGECMCLIGV